MYLFVVLLNNLVVELAIYIYLLSHEVI